MKRKKRNKALTVIITSMLLIFTLIFVYFQRIVMPVIRSVSDEKMRSLTVDAVNVAVKNTLDDIKNYTDIMKISYADDGSVNAISINSYIINKIVQLTTENVAQELNSMAQYGLNIPIGSLSGIMFFAGKGPEICVRVVPVGSVLPELKSEFIEVGINQTYHRIYLNLNTNVNVVLPGAHNSIGTVTEVSICENVIVGKIPETYLNSTSLQDMMDLIP